jgi:hypothetical protein
VQKVHELPFQELDMLVGRLVRSPLKGLADSIWGPRRRREGYLGAPLPEIVQIVGSGVWELAHVGVQVGGPALEGHELLPAQATQFFHIATNQLT